MIDVNEIGKPLTLGDLSEAARITYPDTVLLPYAIVAQSDPHALNVAICGVQKGYLTSVRAETVEERDALQDQVKLAYDVDMLRNRLTRHIRVAAVILGVLVAGGGASAVYANNHGNHQPNDAAIAGVGALTGSVGGFAGWLAGFGLYGRLAKHRAGEIIDEVESQ